MMMMMIMPMLLWRQIDDVYVQKRRRFKLSHNGISSEHYLSPNGRNWGVFFFPSFFPFLFSLFLISNERKSQIHMYTLLDYVRMA